MFANKQRMFMEDKLTLDIEKGGWPHDMPLFLMPDPEILL